MGLITSGKWPIVIPFNLIFVELSGARRKRLINDLDLTGLSRIACLADVPADPEISSRVLSGAIMLCDKDLAVREGGYNRKMISYGWEDIEFFKRFAKLGYYSYTLRAFNLIHLDHRRGPDSRVNEMYEINRLEFERVLKMPIAELQRYVDKDLRIGADIDLDVGNRWSGKRPTNRWIDLRRVSHVINRILTIWQINGTSSIFRRAFRFR